MLPLAAAAAEKSAAVVAGLMRTKKQSLGALVVASLAESHAAVVPHYPVDAAAVHRCFG